jgi:hypothetical protein
MVADAALRLAGLAESWSASHAGAAQVLAAALALARAAAAVISEIMRVQQVEHT